LTEDLGQIGTFSKGGKSMPKRIMIAGYYGFGNTGDEAILEAIIQELRELYAGIAMIVVSGDPSHTERNYPVQAIPWADVQRIKNEMALCDLVLLGGGGLFHDYWGFDPNAVLTSRHIGIAFYTSIALLSAILKKPLMLYAVGAGPLYSEMGKSFVSAIAEQARIVSVRDEESRDQLLSLGITNKSIHVTADPVYNLRATPGGNSLKNPEITGNPILGVTLRNWDFEIQPEIWELQIAQAIDAFLDLHSDGRAIFVPFQDVEEQLLDDVRISERVRGLMKNFERTTLYKSSHSTSEKAAILSECDLVMGMRLHSLILAIASSVPVVGLVYDPKVRYMMVQTGIEKYAIDLKKATSTALITLLEECYQNRDELAHSLHDASPLLAKRAHQTALLAGDLLEQTAESHLSMAPAMERLLRQVTLSLSKTIESSSAQNIELSNTNTGLLEQINSLNESVIDFQEREKSYTESITRLQESEKSQANTINEFQAREEENANTVAKLEKRKITLAQKINKLRESEKRHSQEIDELKGQNKGLADTITEMRAYTNDLSQKYQKIKIDLDHGDDDRKEVTAIKTSRAWKLIWALWQIRLFFVPKGSKMERIIARTWSGSHDLINNTFRHIGTRIKQNMRRLSLKRTRHALVFYKYKQLRKDINKTNLSSLRVPSQKDLVSVVLPVYNGGGYLRESIDSILNQTYQNFEVIIVNDGSRDNTMEIVDEYAELDYRIHVYHQENQKLPKSLTRGFSLAKGEYLTWTSHDNRMKPDYLEKMVRCLKKHPSWDMIYSNMDIIGEHGEFLHNSRWFAGYQQPPGSEHVHLPGDTYELNTWPNNFIGGAFLYRARVKWLIGDYDALQYTREDYDYWMQVNSLLTLKHADFKEPEYDYRFHSDSLTDRDKELGITRDRKFLMVFDDFRRDFYLIPMIWFIDEEQLDAGGEEKLRILKKHLSQAGHILAKPDQLGRMSLPRLWAPQIYLKVTSNVDAKISFPDTLPPGIVRVLLVNSDSHTQLPGSINADWDLCLALGSAASLPSLQKEYQGWWSSSDLQSLINVIDIRVRTINLKQIEKEIHQPQPTKYKASVIICSYKTSKRLEKALYSIANQTMPKEDYEILVVDNHPKGSISPSLVDNIRKENFGDHPDHIRLIHCPIPGLSHARNAGISEATGEILLFIDDDATAKEDALEQYWKAYSEHPEAGVIGGHILLELPDHLSIPWKDGWKGYWSHFRTGYPGYTAVSKWWEFPWGANWGATRKALMQIGGFRGRYGRRGNDFAGGEEIVAASLIQSLGYTIAILPQAEVHHHVEADRFTLQHLKKTIRAGLFTRYQAQKSLHIPVELNLGGSFVEVKETLRKLTFVLSHPKDPASRPTLLETFYHLLARFQLMKQLAVDGLQQFRWPGS
jgi:O-antigen biosynthesis protein